MGQKKLVTMVVIIIVFLILGFGFKALKIETTSEPVLEEVIDADVQESTEETKDDTLLNYSGPAEFTIKTQKFPCADYAFDSEICDKDKTAFETSSDYSLVLKSDYISSDLREYLSATAGGIVWEQNQEYLIFAGCVEENNIYSYSPDWNYSKQNIKSYFDNNLTKLVDIEIETNPLGRDSGCLTVIAKINNIE